MRLFLAIELPAEVRQALATISRPPVAGLRWTAVEQLHLTLKFLGEVPDGDVPRLIETFATTPKPPPIPLVIDGLSLFPPRGRVRIVAAHVADASGSLHRLAADFDSACERVGFPRERRPFTAHITLARARVPVPRERLTFDLPRLAFEGKEFVLMQSQLSDKGSRYSVAARFRL